MGQHRWYLTSVLLGFLLVSLGVLAARWSVLAQRVPFKPGSAAVLEAQSYADEGETAATSAKSGSRPKAENAGMQEHEAEPAGLLSPPQDAQSKSANPGDAPSSAASDGVPGSSTPAGLIDINSADQDALDSLPGIGPKLALAIIEHRKSHGRFTSVEQLLDVPGIGEAKLAELRAHIEVR